MVFPFFLTFKIKAVELEIINSPIGRWYKQPCDQWEELPDLGEPEL